jgi:predicted SprT family Zn-dependent metalloprotease
MTTIPKGMRKNPLQLDAVDDPFEPAFHKAASKARKKALCFHGTSSVFFWPIVEHGLSQGDAKAWDNSSPGVFVAFNEPATELYAYHAVEKFGGDMLCFVLEVSVKDLGIDVDDRDTHDKGRNLQGMVQGTIAPKHITGVLLLEGSSWGPEIPIKTFLRDVQRGKHKAVPGLEPDKSVKPKVGKASPVEQEHGLLAYLVDILNYTSLSNWLLNPDWQKLSRIVLENIYSGRLSTWRSMNAKQWLVAVETMVQEKNTEPYFDQVVRENPWMRRPYYEVSQKFQPSWVDESRGITPRKNPGAHAHFHDDEEDEGELGDDWVTISLQAPATMLRRVNPPLHQDSLLTLAEIEETLRASFAMFDLPYFDVTVQFSNRMKNTAGKCAYNRATKALILTFNGLVWPDFTPEERMGTVQHEAAHAIQFRQMGASDHGTFWKRIARRLGCTGDRCTTAEESRKVVEAYHRSKGTVAPTRTYVSEEDVIAAGYALKVGDHVSFDMPSGVVFGVVKRKARQSSVVEADNGKSYRVSHHFLQKQAPKPVKERPRAGESFDDFLKRTGMARPKPT